MCLQEATHLRDRLATIRTCTRVTVSPNVDCRAHFSTRVSAATPARAWLQRAKDAGHDQGTFIHLKDFESIILSLVCGYDRLIFAF